MINSSITQNDHNLYQNIINLIVNDNHCSTCFEEPEYKPIECNKLDENDTTKVEIINDYYVDNLYNKQPVNVKVKLNLDNVTLHNKLTKYTKTYQNKDNVDEIVKKKEFLNIKKEEKEARYNMEVNEERERKILETKNKIICTDVDKSKTYKRMILFKKNSTYKRGFKM